VLNGAFQLGERATQRRLLGKLWASYLGQAGTQQAGVAPGLVDVEVHAVDTFDFQGHMLADDFGDGARYTYG
jgi:hypothetical protein